VEKEGSRYRGWADLGGKNPERSKKKKDVQMERRTGRQEIHR